MNQWTMHERSATLRTDSEPMMQHLMGYVTEGLITLSKMQKQDGLFSVEVFVTPQNNFRQTMNYLLRECSQFMYNG